MSPEESVRASLGLHRGRRALAVSLVVLVLAGALGWVSATSTTAPPPVAVTPEPPPPAPPAPPRAVKPKRLARTPLPSKPVTAAPSSIVEAAPTELASPPPPPPPPPPEPEPEPLPAPEPEEAAASGNALAIAQQLAASQRAAVRGCFERALKLDPTLRGTVEVEFELAPPDRIEAVRVSDSFARPAFTACVTEVMQRARITGLDEPCTVRVPWQLSPEARR